MTQQRSGSSCQRCRAHSIRNLRGAVSAKHAPAVTAAVKTVFAHTDTCEEDPVEQRHHPTGRCPPARSVALREHDCAATDIE